MTNRKLLVIAENIIKSLNDDTISAKYFRLKDKLIDAKIQNLIQEISTENENLTNNINVMKIINESQTVEQCYTNFTSYYHSLFLSNADDPNIESNYNLIDEYKTIIKALKEQIYILQSENYDLHKKYDDLHEEQTFNLNYITIKEKEKQKIHNDYQLNGDEMIKQLDTQIQSISKQIIANREENNELMKLNESFDSHYSAKNYQLNQILEKYNEKANSTHEIRKRYQLYSKDVEFKQSQIDSLRNSVYNAINGATPKQIERIKNLEADISSKMQENNQLQLDLNRITFS